MATFVMNVLWNRKVKKLAHLPGYWLDLAQIWCRGVFLDSKSKINNKIFIRRHSNVKMTCRYITYIWLAENAYDVNMTSPFVKFFENVNLSSSYDRLSPHQIWFNLDQGNQSYGGGRNPPQVENVLNRPCEIGLKRNF